MKHNDTGFILISADGVVHTAERASTVLSCTGVLVVGGKSLGERGREAPKSQSTREMIEESANMGKNELESVCVSESPTPLGRGLPPPFIGSRRAGYMYGVSLMSPSSLRIGGGSSW